MFGSKKQLRQAVSPGEMVSSPLPPAQPKHAGALLEKIMAHLLLSRMTVWVHGQPEPGPSLQPGNLHRAADTQQTSCDWGAGVSQLCHAVGSQGMKDFLAFALLTVQMRVRRDTYSFAERQSAPHMRGAKRDKDGYMVSFPQCAAAHSLHRNA